jgi:hypothetical protein
MRKQKYTGKTYWNAQSPDTSMRGRILGNQYRWDKWESLTKDQRVFVNNWVKRYINGNPNITH